MRLCTVKTSKTFPSLSQICTAFLAAATLITMQPSGSKTDVAKKLVFLLNDKKAGFKLQELSGAVAQKCINTATWLWIIVCSCLYLRASKVQMSVPIYAECSPRTLHPRGASTLKSCSGW